MNKDITSVCICVKAGTLHSDPILVISSTVCKSPPTPCYPVPFYSTTVNTYSMHALVVPLIDFVASHRMKLSLNDSLTLHFMDQYIY